MKRGFFITLEGMDGSGKTTQHGLLVKYLRQRGLAVRETREPGGTRVGEEIRRILLADRDGRADKLAPLAELTLMYAARAQHLEEVVRPALARGQLVLSDRFNDASMAYQGHGRQLGAPAVRALDRIICGHTQPDLTLVLDLPARLALERARGRETRRRSKHGHFEAQSFRFHERVRAGYLAIARRDPRRVKVVQADQPVAEVERQIRRVVDLFLRSKGLGTAD
jgi:dTMP kinase